MAFDPKTEYDITFDAIAIRDFVDYSEEFVVRPPYQRKTVWNRQRQQDLLDSLFRRYYIPRIVIRLVRLSDSKTMREVIDGQQRITTVQAFLNNELSLPKSLEDIHPDLAGRYYRELSSDLRRFVDRELKYNADIIKGIDDPHDPEHQRIAAEIFWRLQQGESLNYMEIAHARLSSLARNFIVKYGDDIGFNYAEYHPLDHNPDKHEFFRLYDRDNARMQHLSLLARLLLIELAKGPTNTRDAEVIALIEETQEKDGIGNTSYEKQPAARALLSNLRSFYKIFADDPMLDRANGLKEFKVEYFVISIYLLLRHLLTYYVFEDGEAKLFREFVYDFHRQWISKIENDTDMLLFKDNRQQSKNETELRDRILRQAFFTFASARGHVMLAKDGRRAFNEAERIEIYRRANGLCEQCRAEEKPEQECRVSWSQYEADHVLPHSKGGRTSLDNAQLLCSYHNQSKGARIN